MRILRSCKKKNKSTSYKNSFSFQNALPMIAFKAPESFTMASHSEFVINYVNNIYRTIQDRDNRCRIFLDVDDVQTTDNGAVGILLALINALSQKDIHTFGNLPSTEESRKIFEKSGFLGHVKLLQGKKSKTTDNFIVQKGKDKTNASAIGREVRKIIKHLTGEESSYKPLYSLIGEMVSNSIEHANKKQKDKNWLLSIHYETNKVVIMVTDIGKGIMMTLKKKIRQKVQDTFISNVDTLLNLFSGKYQSSTFENNRNKGLPLIKECSDNNFISNLYVITNNVFLDFNNNNSHEMSSNFKGTFYSWEVTKNNIEIWNKRTK